MIARIGLIAALGVMMAAGAARAEPPLRVLSVGGAVTETVYALGAGDRLVAVDSTSYYPAAAKSLPNVGYVRSLAAEGLLSLKANVLLAGPEAGPPEILDQVAGAGMKVVRLHDGFTLQSDIDRIEMIGEVLGRKAQARALTDALTKDMATVKAEVAKARSHPRVLFLLATGHGAPMVAGQGTAADAMITLAGGVNAVEDVQGYKPLSPEAAIAATPDILMMMSQSVDAMGGEAAVLAEPNIAHTKAAQTKRLVVVDGLYGLGFGPRLAHAVHDLAVAFHPDEAFPALPARAWTTSP